MAQTGFVRIFLGLGVIISLIIICGLFLKASPQISAPKAITVQPSPSPKNPYPYIRPTIPVKRAYLTFLVGDSIVGSLGRNANQLRLDLISNYPAHEFVNYNYGFGSTNILTVPDRLNTQTTYLGETFPPIIDQTFDLIIFESFAFNPLSEYPLEEGLKKQTEILDSSIREIISKRPNSVVAIMTPIAPSVENFGKGVLNLTPEVRKQWVKERIAYITNAIDFAQKNNIPLINVYSRSLKPSGLANLDYIDSSDYIHPSAAGVKLISKTIADFIYENQIFPD